MSTKKTKTKKAAAKVAKVKPEAAPVATSPKEAARRWKVWAPDHENAALTFAAAEATAAALDFCRVRHPEPDGNRCASVNMSESDIYGRVRVFLNYGKPVPYLFAEEIK